MAKILAPKTVVQRQLDAYNSRDIDALLATYAADAKQYEHPGILLASGHDQIRKRMAVRFQDATLHARLIQRVVMGDIVVDHEEVRRMFPEGSGRIAMVAIYQVRDGLIQSASIALGEKMLDADDLD
jgi:hypothetical protein